MRRYEGGIVSAYRPPDVAELTPRECAQARATVQTGEKRLRETWQSYLGPRADLADWRVGGADETRGALAWQCAAWRGTVRCDPHLQRGIIAAATGFDSVAADRDRPLGAVETAVLRTVLAAVLRSLLEAFGLQTRETMTWRDRPGADAGMAVHVAGSAAGIAGTITWQLPLSAARRPAAAPTEEQRAGLQDAVGGGSVTLQAVLAGPRLTRDEIASLVPGDIVLLAGQSMEQVTVIVSGRPVARGQPGLRSGKLALRITQIPLVNEVPNEDEHR